MATHDAETAARNYLLSAESINAKARLIVPIAELADRKQQLEQKLLDVDRDLLKAHEAAAKGGWKPAELAELGYPTPKKTRKRRTRAGAPTQAPQVAPTPTGGVSHDGR